MVSAPCSACRADRNAHGAATEQLSTGRHRDKPAADNWPLPNYRLIKVFIAIFDIPESGGATVRRHSPTQNRMLLTHRRVFGRRLCLEAIGLRRSRVAHWLGATAAARQSGRCPITRCRTTLNARWTRAALCCSTARSGTQACRECSYSSPQSERHFSQIQF